MRAGRAHAKSLVFEQDDQHLTIWISVSSQGNLFLLRKNFGCELINDQNWIEDTLFSIIKWIKQTDQNLAYHSPSMKLVPSLRASMKWVLMHIRKRCVLHLTKNFHQEQYIQGFPHESGELRVNYLNPCVDALESMVVICRRYGDV
jgi:hypothetical protein